MRISRRLVVGTVVALVAATGVAWLALRPAPQTDSPAWLTQPVERGNLRRSITATGALQPVGLVQVGTQVSGTIRTLHVDFNSTVRAGQLLAEIDTTALDAELAQVQAQRASAASSLALAQSSAAQQQRLFEQGFVSQAVLDQSQASLRSAQAALQAQEALARRATFNRRNAEIRSPVAGTVIAREISVGQTVAASLQTPVLFRIAQDLREMQIEASVAEADVGLLREGQPVRFAVDAFPERGFEGRVRQIRNNHQVQQNVVTYTAVIAARNEDLSLRPGMTAYVNVTVAERESVLRVPNAALRWAPATGPNDAPRAAPPPGQRVVWRSDGRTPPQPLTVRLGLSDGRFTELLGGELREGDPLVVGERKGGARFGPRFF